MDNMSEYMANKIMKQADISLEKGREKYKAYFVKTHIYERYRSDCDLILRTTESKITGETYENCIVEE